MRNEEKGTDKTFVMRNIMRNAAKDSIIMLGILAAIIICAVLFVFIPQAKKLDEIRSQIAAEKTSLEADAQKVRIIPQMLRHIEAMKNRYNERWEKKLPRLKELGGFLREIGQNLEEADLSGKLIESGSPKKEELFHTLPIVMRFQGSFGALSKFLKRLDDMERLARIQKLNITADNKHVPAKLDIQLQMNIYFTDAES